MNKYCEVKAESLLALALGNAQCILNLLKLSPEGA
jgi:hypothetical protein